MATLLDLAQAAQAANRQRAAVQVYAPGRVLPQRAPAPARRPMPAASRLPQRNRSASTGSRLDALLDRYENSPEAQKIRMEEYTAQLQAQQKALQEQAAQKSFWGHGVGKGLGVVINNPLTKALLVPIGALQTGGKLMTNVVEEYAKHAPDWAEGPLPLWVDEERIKEDKRNLWEKISPTSTYGFGEIAQSTGNKWVDRGVGLTGDILLDPLTYVGGGATRLIPGASKVDEAGRIVTTGARRAVLPPNAAGRLNILGEMALEEGGSQLIKEFGPEFAHGSARGFLNMSPEAQAALRIEKPGLRLRGGGPRIPGTAPIAQKLAETMGAARGVLEKIPGEGRLRNFRTPRGMEAAYDTLARSRGGDILRAATDVGVRNAIRQGEKTFEALGERALSSAYKDAFKGVPKEQIAEMMARAESDPAPNAVNELFQRLRSSFEEATGRTLDEAFLRDDTTYVPHVLDPSFRRVLKDATHRGGRAGTQAEQFMKRSNIVSDDLLEGSGFLEKSRRLVAGTEFDIGDHHITIGDDTIAGLNANQSLREAFPGYRGKFFLDDPAQIAEIYVKSLARQAGRDFAAEALVRSGNPLAREISGDLADLVEKQAEALRLQGPGTIVESMRTPYVPGQDVPKLREAPIVPGSADDMAVRAQKATLTDELAAATTPEQKAAVQAQLDQLPETTALDPTGILMPGGTAHKGETAARNEFLLGEGRAHQKAMRKDIAQTVTDVRETVGRVRQDMFEGLKTERGNLTERIKEAQGEINRLNHELGGIGKVNVVNADQLQEILAQLDKMSDDLAREIKRKGATWRQRASRARRALEADLRGQQRQLVEAREKAERLLDAAPSAVKAEVEARRAYLNRPVEAAQNQLEKAEALFREAPHSEHVVNRAAEKLRTSFELDDAYQQAADEVRAAAERVRAAEAAAPGLRRNAEQQAAFEAQLKRAQTELEATEKLAKEKLNPKQPEWMNIQRKQARARLPEIKERVKRLEAEAEAQAEPLAARAEYKKAQERLNDLAQKRTTSPYDKALAEREALTAQAAAGTIDEAGRKRLRTLKRLFNKGGQFNEERNARQVIKEMEEWAAARDADPLVVEAKRRLASAQAEKVRQIEALLYSRVTGQRILDRSAGFTPTGSLRNVVPVDQARRGEAMADIIPGRPGERPRAVPPRITEQEAIWKLEGQYKPQQAAAEARAREAGRAERAGARTIEQRVEQGKQMVGEQIYAARDAELGPLSARHKTMENLNEDLGNKVNMVTKRDHIDSLKKRLRSADPSYRKRDLLTVIDEIDAVRAQNPLLDDDAMNATESLLQSNRQQVERVSQMAFRAKDEDRIIQAAADGKLVDVMLPALHNNWKAMHSGPLARGDIIMDAELHRRFTNLFELNREPTMFGRTFNSLTNLFKTYATLSPGFHVRNALSGIFMNTSDGVTLANQFRGVTLWREFMKNDEKWLAKQTPEIQNAFRAAFGSGAGGQFLESGMLGKSSSQIEAVARAYNKAMNNPLTRLSRRFGTKVEGALRLGMALDTIERGGSVYDAMDRITRIHFDYGQVSQFDEGAKRLIPFWTFMSRNLPMQVQQMYTNPRLYSYFEHLKQNTAVEPPPFTPGYWDRLGYWDTGADIAGQQLFATPDIGYTRVLSDINSLGDALSGQNPGALLTNANPMFMAPIDFIQHRDTFYDRNYTPADTTKLSGPIGAPVTMLAKLLGQTNEIGEVNDNFLNLLTSMTPPLSQSQRLAPQLMGQEGGRQQLEALARWGGVPARTLSPQQQQNEFWRQRRALLDEINRQRSMLEAQAS